MAASTWNTDAWHWEEKTFTPWASEYLSKAFQAVAVADGEIALRVIEQLAFRAEASVSFRKGKLLTLLLIDAKYKWEGKYVGGDGKEVVYGLLHVPELVMEDVDTDFTVVTNTRGSTRLDELARSLASREMVPLVRGIVRRFVEELREKVAAEEAAVPALPPPAPAPSAPALISGAGSEAAPPPPSSAPVAIAASSAPVTIAASSETDSAALHMMWQEKPWTKWAHDFLRAAFHNHEFEFPNGTLRLTDILEMRGDAFTAFRRGAKTAFFEMNFKLKWEAEEYSDDGAVLRSGDGEIHVMDFDQNSDIPKFPVKVVVCDDADENDHKVAVLVTKYGVREVRRVLLRFAKELNGKE